MVLRALGLPPDKVHGIWVLGPRSYGRNDGAMCSTARVSRASTSILTGAIPRTAYSLAGQLATSVPAEVVASLPGFWRPRRSLRFREQAVGWEVRLLHDRASPRAHRALAQRSGKLGSHLSSTKGPSGCNRFASTVLRFAFLISSRIPCLVFCVTVPPNEMERSAIRFAALS